MGNRRWIYHEKIKNVLLIISFAIVSVVVVYGNQWIGGLEGDMMGYHVMPHQLIHKTMVSGELSLWMPELWGGITAFHSLNTPFSPIANLISWLGSNKTAFVGFETIEVLVIVHLWIFQIGAYYMLKNVGISRVAAWISTIICGVGAYLWFPSWFNIYITVAYAPALLAVVMYLYKVQNPIFGWANIGVAFVLSQILMQQLGQAAALVLLLWGILYVFYAVYYRDSRLEIIRITLKSVFSGLLAIGIAAVAIVPTIAMNGVNSRLINDFGYLAPGEKMSFLSFSTHTFDKGTLKNLLGESQGFLTISVAVLILIIVGFFSKTTSKEISILACLGKTALLFSVVGGCGVWFCDFLYYIPVANQVRQPFLYCIIFCIGSCILGGIGADCALRALKEKKWKDYFYNPTLLLFLVCSIAIIAILPHRFNFINATIVVVLGLIVVAQFWKNINQARCITTYLCIALVLINIYYVRQKTVYNYTVDSANAKVGLVNESINSLFAQFEEATNDNMFRITQWGNMNSLPINSAVYNGFYNTVDYWNPIYQKTINTHLSLNLETRFKLENVKYWIKAEDDTAIDPLTMEFEDTGITSFVYNSYDATAPIQVRVYENTDYLGPAWFVYDFETISEDATDDEQLAALNNTELDVRTTALVDTKTATKLSQINSDSPNGTILSINYTNNNISINCFTEAEGLLILTESDAPGWKAWIDGERTDVLSVNYDRKGIVVPAGEHNIQLVYLPDSFIAGVIITTISVVATIGYFLVYFWKCVKRKKGLSRTK